MRCLAQWLAQTHLKVLSGLRLTHEQDTVLKRVAFQRKQRALRDAIAIGARLVRRRQRMLTVATFLAWRGRTQLLRAAAAKRESSLAGCARRALLHWRAYGKLRVYTPACCVYAEGTLLCECMSH